MSISKHYIEAPTGKRFDIANIKKQNGLKRDIVELVLNVATPDDDCMLLDFLQALQFILDKHEIK